MKTVFLAMLAAVAVSADAADAPQFARPEGIEQAGRFMPGFGNDGLVRVSYTVKADGTTDDIKLHGYLTNPFLENMLKQNVGKWTFKPGTVDGKPADFQNQEYLIVVRVDPNAPPPPGPGGNGRRGGGAPQAKPGETAAAPLPVDPSKIPLALSVKAKETIDAAFELLRNKEFDKALKSLDQVAKRDLHTVYDFALVNQLRGSALASTNQLHEALEAFELATLSSPSPQGEPMFLLDDKLLEQALRQKFAVAATLRHNGEAWDTYQLILKKYQPAADDRIHEQAKAVKALLDSPDAVALLAKLGEKEEWTYHPIRRTFTVADLKGKLSKITAHCDRRTLELKYQKDVDWTLPPGFGDCTLVFEGDEGAQFTVYEAN